MTTDMGTRASRAALRPAPAAVPGQRPDPAGQPGRRPGDQAARATAPPAPPARRTGKPGVHPPGRRPPGMPSGPPAAAPGRAAPQAPGTRPRRVTGPAAPRTAPAAPRTRPAVAAGAAAAVSGVPKTRFILLVIGLLAGGLVCLLVINTTLAAAQFRITALQKGNADLAQQQQELQQKVAEEKSATSLERRARALGMRPQARPNFLNLRTGKTFRSPTSLPGVPSVPGYAP
jgi:hypothetical protein